MGRFIVLFLDNFSAHFLCKIDKATKKRVVLYDPKNIKIVFLPKNSTSLSQPLDQGIIKNIKDKYRYDFAWIFILFRHIILKLRIKCIEEKREWKFNLLHALRIVKKAWEEVSPATIQNCFKHAKFIRQVCYYLIVNFFVL